MFVSSPCKQTVAFVSHPCSQTVVFVSSPCKQTVVFSSPCTQTVASLCHAGSIQTLHWVTSLQSWRDHPCSVQCGWLETIYKPSSNTFGERSDSRCRTRQGQHMSVGMMTRDMSHRRCVERRRQCRSKGFALRLCELNEHAMRCMCPCSCVWLVCAHMCAHVVCADWFESISCVTCCLCAMCVTSGLAGDACVLTEHACVVCVGACVCCGVSL